MKEVIKLSRSKLMALQLTNSIQKTGGLLVQNIPPTWPWRLELGSTCANERGMAFIPNSKLFLLHSERDAFRRSCIEQDLRRRLHLHIKFNSWYHMHYTILANYLGLAWAYMQVCLLPLYRGQRNRRSEMWLDEWLLGWELVEAQEGHSPRGPDL